MKILKKHKNKLIICGFILAVLAVSLWYGGGVPESYGKSEPSEADYSQRVSSVLSDSDKVVLSAEESIAEENDETVNEEQKKEAVSSGEKKEGVSAAETDSASVETEESKKLQNFTDKNTPSENKEKVNQLPEPVPESTSTPVEPEDSEISDKEFTCTISVRCDTILDNMERLDAEKRALIPEDGIVFAEKTVSFYEGESVFNLLLREMKRNRIHMEFENTPIYKSSYIEGIANIYEFDCGELSGWMYKVNGYFPNYGCSAHLLKAGDKVEWIYTCNLGVDIGGQYAAKGQMK